MHTMYVLGGDCLCVVPVPPTPVAEKGRESCPGGPDSLEETQTTAAVSGAQKEATGSSSENPGTYTLPSGEH